MSAFDPASVRQAVAEFTPRSPARFQDLAPAREVIVELRRKHASYREIAELLTQHGLPTSRTTVTAFCHEILGDVNRPKRRAIRKRPPTSAPGNLEGQAPPAGVPQPPPHPPLAGNPPDGNQSETRPATAR